MRSSSNPMGEDDFLSCAPDIAVCSASRRGLTTHKNMKNPLQLGPLGYYGATIDPVVRERVSRKNELIDEWNSIVLAAETIEDQERLVADWRNRMGGIV